MSSIFLTKKENYRIMDMEILKKLKNREEVFYEIKHVNKIDTKFSLFDAYETKLRFERFAKIFIEAFDEIVDENYYKSEMKKSKLGEEVYLKLDSHLKVARSVKARGGFNEVISYIEKVLEEKNLLAKFSSLELSDIKEIMKDYTIEVSSTGNLGLSIGLCAKAFGFKTKVHMSRDAKEWKKDMLRSAGAEVLEYDNDYTYAVKMGRLSASQNPDSYFVDDEMSEKLFLGYASSIFEIIDQVKESAMMISYEEPLNVFLPCGVGGAPGGIAFALRSFFKDYVKIYFLEPTEYPSMLYSYLMKKASSVKDIGLASNTVADGLACASPSKLVFPMLDYLVDGFFAFNDDNIIKAKEKVLEVDNEIIEASSATAILAYEKLNKPKNSLLWITGSNVDK